MLMACATLTIDVVGLTITWTAIQTVCLTAATINRAWMTVSTPTGTPYPTFATDAPALRIGRGVTEAVVTVGTIGLG